MAVLPPSLLFQGRLRDIIFLNVVLFMLLSMHKIHLIIVGPRTLNRVPSANREIGLNGRKKTLPPKKVIQSFPTSLGLRTMQQCREVQYLPGPLLTVELSTRKSHTPFLVDIWDQ